MRPRLTTIITRLLAGLLLGQVLLGMAGCTPTPRDSFATYDQAVKAGGFESGLLPAVIPQTATNIYAVQAADSSQVWVAFDFPPEAAESFTSLCSPISFDDAELPASGPRWWDSRALKDPWNAFFVCGEPADQGYLAVLGSGEQAYYWSSR